MRFTSNCHDNFEVCVARGTVRRALPYSAVRKLEQEQNTWGGSCSPNRALLNVALARERLL